MRVRWTLPSLTFVLFALSAMNAQQTPLTGCLSQDASGSLRFEALPSRTIYRLQATDIDSLQRHVNQQLAMTGNAAGGGQSGTFKVENFEVLSENCTSVQPTQDTSGVPGKVGQVQVATPITSAGSANETTPGFQTEAGLEQASGENVPGAVKKQKARAPFRPIYAEQAGESSLAAETDAQAASRAELYPGTILGVDIRNAPPSSVQSSQQQTTTGSNNPE